MSGAPTDETSSGGPAGCPQGPGSRSGRRPAGVAQSLPLGGGLAAAERAGLVARLSALDGQLARYPADAVELELSVEARGTPGQHLTLECSIPGGVQPVAGSAAWDLRAALVRVREGMRRQLDDATRHGPGDDRRVHRPVPDPDGSPGPRALAGQGGPRSPVGAPRSAHTPSRRSSR